MDEGNAKEGAGVSRHQFPHILNDLFSLGLVSVVSQAFFAVGVALLSLLAYFVQDDWRHLTQGATLLGIPFVFLIAFVLPESPRWLQSQGRTEAAVKVMQHIAAKNGAQWSCVEDKGNA